MKHSRNKCPTTQKKGDKRIDFKEKNKCPWKQVMEKKLELQMKGELLAYVKQRKNENVQKMAGKNIRKYTKDRRKEVKRRK